MATTTNYSWTTPDNTAYVKDGASAIRTLGSSVDTTLFTALGGDYPGLRLVKKQTIGSAVSSVSVTNAFSATYDNYKIIVSGGSASAGAELRLTMTGSTANYAYQLNYATYGATTALSIGSGSNSYFDYVGYASSTISANFDLIGPNKAQHTQLCNASYSSGGATGTTNGYHFVATAYTGFTLTTSANTLTGGTIYVYGYGAS
jgi:hypothetical protein